MKLLLIEDEPDLLLEIKNYLIVERFLCETATNYADADQKLAIYHYDIAVVDLTLPGGSGLKLIETLKKQHKNTGVIIISAKNSLADKLKGLDLGADDYLTKPFHLAELNSRIKAILRRRKYEGQNEIIHHEILISLDSGSVKVYNQLVTLTKKEHELLLFFIGNKNRLLTKESIVEHLWGDHIDMADNFDFIYTHINNLRKKLMKAGGNDYLKTIYGMGYKFTDI